MKYILIGIPIIAIIISASTPWMTTQDAMKIVEKRAYDMQKSNPNLCALSIDESTIKQVPFGFTERVSYDCTKTNPAFGILKGTNSVFITFYGGLIDMPSDSVVLNNAY